MPYLVITPTGIGSPSYTLTTPHTSSPFIVLSSTNPLHKTMLKDFQFWNYLIAYLSLHAPSTPAPIPNPSKRPHTVLMEYPSLKGFTSKLIPCQRLEHAHFTQRYDQLPSAPQYGSRSEARRWYAAHEEVAARTGYTARVFAFWERRHGREIERRWLRRQREGRGVRGVGNRVKDVWWRVCRWARGKR